MAGHELTGDRDSLGKRTCIALLPRHQAHTFKNIGTDPGRLLTVILPAGFERFFEVVAERRLGDDDLDEIATVAAEFGLEILGPPPA